MLWSVAALGLALAMTPLYVGLCQSLSALSSRSAHRLAATQRGAAELERLRTEQAAGREFTVPELPSGKGRVTLQQAGPLRRATVRITWDENGRTTRAVWTTLIEEEGHKP